MITARHYYALGVKVGKGFVGSLGNKIRGVRACRWNEKRFIIFQAVTLKRTCHVTTFLEILWRIWKRLDAWESGQYQMLVEETAHTCE